MLAEKAILNQVLFLMFQFQGCTGQQIITTYTAQCRFFCTMAVAVYY